MAKKQDNRMVNNGMEGMEISTPEEAAKQKAEEIDLTAEEERAADKAWKEVNNGQRKKEA